MKRISANEAARQIGISTATVRNWVKAGHMTPLPGDGISFDEREVSRIKADLANGQLGKLRSRANKIKSNTRFVPVEYAENHAVVDVVAKLCALRETHRWPNEMLLFAAALQRLEINGDVDRSLGKHSRRWFGQLIWRRECVQNEMRHWHDELPQKPDFETYAQIAEPMAQRIAEHHGDGWPDDFLGVLYQALFREGDKSQAGSYYTPTQYVFDALQWAAPKPGETMLDPCCGSGKYFVMAVRHFGLQAENCFGFDIDPIAVRLARVNLFLAAPECGTPPNIFRCDALSDAKKNGPFDLVATNPPWGAYKNINRGTKHKPASKESFALFLLDAISRLKPGGRLSFLLPEAFLNIKTHAEIRKYVLTQTALHSVVALGRGFSGVFTGTIRLDLVNKKPLHDHRCQISIGNGDTYAMEQAAFLRNRHCVFDINVMPYDRAVLEKIFATPHSTLENNADWALGIVTGNNAKHLLNTPAENAEPLLRGSDIAPYRPGMPSQYMRFEPASYQQAAPEIMYRASEKLVYRFISNKLVFAYDTQGRLTLNSANVLIPRLPGMRARVVMAFLNSTLFQYIFEKKFSTHKVLRGDLEQLPFPVISRKTHDAIESLVDVLLETHSDNEIKRVTNEIDELVFQCFPVLTKTDVARIRDCSTP